MCTFVGIEHRADHRRRGAVLAGASLCDEPFFAGHLCQQSLAEDVLSLCAPPSSRPSSLKYISVPQRSLSSSGWYIGVGRPA
jgi:hypothetical protein